MEGGEDERTASGPRSRRAWWLAAAVALVAFAALRFGWSEPRYVTATEADAALGGLALATALTDDGPDAAQGMKARLVRGFEPAPQNPRLGELPGDAGARRAVIEPPLPRWLAGLGIALAPGGDETPNFARAGTASALAFALALGLLAFGLRRRGAVSLVAPALVVLMPGALDASVSGGAGASAVLVTTALVLAAERLARTARGAVVVAVLVGLAAAVHPFALSLVVPVFVAYAIAREPRPDGGATGSSLPLPSAPLGLYLLPIVAVVVLVAVWPALWSETGKRLGSYLLDYGQAGAPRHEVLGLVFEPRADRGGPAWTALLQWVAWVPYPVIGLWVLGLARAIARGRDGRWFPILAWLALVVCGALDGGLFGARASLVPLLWIPTAVTASDGAVAFMAWVRARLGGTSRPWPAVALALALAAPVAQAVLVTTWGAASQGGAELRFALPVGFVDRVAAEDPGAVVAVVQGPSDAYEPQLEVLRTQLERDIAIGDPARAGWVITVGDVRPESEPLLAGLGEVARDGRPGVRLGLWHRERAP